MKTSQGDASDGAGTKGHRSPTLDALVADGMADEVITSVRRAAVRRVRRRRMVVSGSALALVVACGSWFVRSEAPRAPAALVQVTRDATLKRELADGSVVDLNRGAQIRVAFEADIRRVDLLQGEAHFQVAKDPQRPFVVTAGNVSVRAVGTGFAIEVGRDAVEVIVTEGRVTVGREVAPGAFAASLPILERDPLQLGSGERITLPRLQSSPPTPEPISVVDLKARLQWRVPLLELSATPLGEALVAFNRHGDRRLTLGDPELATLELSGVLRADNVDALLRLLKDEFGLEAEQRGGDVVLRRR